MLPTPETSVWSSRARLTPVRRLRQRATSAFSSRVGSSGSRAMCATWGGSHGPEGVQTPRFAPPRPPGPPSAVGTRGTTSRPPNIRWSTNRSSRPCAAELSEPPSSRLIRTRRCRSASAPGGWRTSWPLIPRCARSASPVSSSIQRNLPRRATSRTTAPVSRAAKSTGPASCQRTTRGWSTSTASTRAPITQRARPARTTSTSGSSGTGGQTGSDRRGFVGRQEARARAVLRHGAPERPEGGGGGALLGLLLALAAALAADGGPHEDGGVEGLGVVRTLLGHHVLRDAEVQLCGELLQAGLPVQARAERGGRCQQRVDEAADEGGRDLDAVLDVDRADQRLDGVGEDRGLVPAAAALLALAEQEVVTDAERAGDVRKRAAVDDGGTQFRELALGLVRVPVVERVGDDEAQHGVPEELQALVGRQVAVLVRVGAVRQGPLEQAGGKGNAEGFDQLPDVTRSVRRRHGNGAVRQLRGP